jgi:hypothetical protein
MDFKIFSTESGDTGKSEGTNLTSYIYGNESALKESTTVSSKKKISGLCEDADTSMPIFNVSVGGFKNYLGDQHCL